LALTSPTGGGRSVGIVRVRTKATEFSLVVVVLSSTGLRCLFVDLHFERRVFSRTVDSDETDVTVFIGS